MHLGSSHRQETFRRLDAHRDRLCRLLAGGREDQRRSRRLTRKLQELERAIEDEARARYRME